MAKTLAKRIQDSIDGGTDEEARRLLERVVLHALNYAEGELVDKIDPLDVAQLCAARGWSIDEFHAQLRKTTTWKDCAARAGGSFGSARRMAEIDAELRKLAPQIEAGKLAARRSAQLQAEAGNLQLQNVHNGRHAARLARLEEQFPACVEVRS